MEIKKAIILVAGLGTRFLPLSKVVSKELWPLVDKPIVHYLLQEAKLSGINQIVFVLSPERKEILSYFKEAPGLEKILRKRKRDQALVELKNLQELQKDLSISRVFQQKPLGDGHAILRAQEKIGKEPFTVLFCDDIVESKTPCLLQLLKIFKTCQRPVIALSRVSKEKIPSYGIVQVEKIANRLFKIKKIFEKPPIEKAPSDLAILGKYVLIPEIFDYLKTQKPNERGEIILADALENSLKDGKIIYGYEIEGKWLECGEKMSWLKSHLYLSLKHPQFGEELKKYLKEIM